jgi:hypothetical protein
VTTTLIDVASWQGALRPEDVARAGFDIVNLKVSHGLGQLHVHPDVAGWVAAARRLGLGLSTFHYLTGDASGEAQAEYAYSRLAGLDLLYGTAHLVDVEAPTGITLAIVRGYLTRMTELLARPPGLYTYDYWWQSRGWNVSALTPYLMAPPNDPAVADPAGDAAWKAGYGGWPTLSVLQYAVSPLPGGTIKVSQSAIRDPAVWTALTLGRTGMSYAPATLLAARALILTTLPAMNPLSAGIVGDDSHAAAGTSYHLGKDALQPDAYSIVESSRDRNGLTDAASALDVGWFAVTVGGKLHNLRSFSVWLVAQCKAGTADTLDIREVIYSPDGVVVKRWDRLGIRSTGPSSHLTHTHLSYFRDSEHRDKTALFVRYFTLIGLIDMPLDNTDIKAIWNTDNIIAAPDGSKNADGTPNEYWSPNSYLYWTYRAATQTRDAANAALAVVKDIAGRPDVDEVALVAALTGPVVAGIVAALPSGDQISQDEVTTAVEAAFAKAFGG